MNYRVARPPWWRFCFYTSLALNGVVVVVAILQFLFWDDAPNTLWFSGLAVVFLTPPLIYSHRAVRYWRARGDKARRELRELFERALVEHHSDGSFPEYCVACKELGDVQIWPCPSYVSALTNLHDVKGRST